MMIKWENREHMETVVELLEKYDKLYEEYNEVDLEYFPAYYLLGTSLLRQKTLSFINEDGIKFFELQEQPFSSSERLMMQLSNNLFNNRDKVNVLDLISAMGNTNFELCMTSIYLRRESIDIDTFKESIKNPIFID